MVRISFLYPNQEESRFDFEYYLETHMPMATRWLSAQPGYRGVSIERGLNAGAGAAPYVAVCHFLFDTLEDFMAAIAPHAEALRGDIRNYTDVPPVVQVSEVLSNWMRGDV